MKETTKRLLMWAGIIAGLVLLVVGLAKAGTPSPTNQTLSLAVDTSDHVNGTDTASVTVVEYSDFQCPACASYQPLVKDLVAALPDDVRIVYRHYPLQSIHRHALLAAKASEAASLQGKFWEYHDMLFNTQRTWTNADNARDMFVSYAESLGLNKDQFISDLDSDTVKDRVFRDISSATEMDLSGTPTFFVNGKRIQNPRSLEEFKVIVNAEKQ